MARNLRESEELLESDDEFPDDYDETPDLPAYQNDHRFDMIEFSWIKDKNYPVHNELKYDAMSQSSQSEAEVMEHSIDLKINSGKTLIKTGILSQQDVLCLKYIASTFTDVQALLQFVDFLIHKDMQSKYNYLTSCLIGDLDWYNFNEKSKQYNIVDNKYIFDVIIKSNFSCA